MELFWSNDLWAPFEFSPRLNKIEVDKVIALRVLEVVDYRYEFVAKRLQRLQTEGVLGRFLQEERKKSI